MSKLQDDIHRYLLEFPRVDAFDAAEILYEKQGRALDDAMELLRAPSEQLLDKGTGPLH
jgi:hypothetical protein